MIKDGARFHRYLSMDFTILKKGEDALFVPTFWVNFHFSPKIDFVANFIPKKRKSFLKWSLPSTH